MKHANRMQQVVEQRLTLEAARVECLLEIDSPLIPPIDTSGERSVFRLPPGATRLADWLPDMHEEEIWRLVGCISRALEPFHAAGWVLLNLEPEALFLTDRGEPLSIDFGYLSRSGQALDHVPDTCYSAPECQQGVAGGPEADVFALGCLLYRLLTGKPFDYLELGDGLERVPPARRHLLARLLAIDPGERPADMADLRATIETSHNQTEPACLVEAASVTHVGFNPGRALNQDASLLAWQQEGDWRRTRQRGLFAVIDGMGGMEEGHRAAQLARESFERGFSEFLFADPAPGAIDLMTRAHHAVASLGGRAGAAATLLLLDGDHVDLAQVGDTRAYLLRDNEVFQLTLDQSQRALTGGPRGAAEGRSQLVSSLGMPVSDAFRVGTLLDVRNAGGLLPETVRGRSLQLLDGDQLLLCSDGLWDWWDDCMSEEEEHAYLLDVLQPGKSIHEALRQLLQDALEHDGQDNATAVLVRCRREALFAGSDRVIEKTKQEDDPP